MQYLKKDINDMPIVHVNKDSKYVLLLSKLDEDDKMDNTLYGINIVPIPIPVFFCITWLILSFLFSPSTLLLLDMYELQMKGP